MFWKRRWYVITASQDAGSLECYELSRKRLSFKKAQKLALEVLKDFPVLYLVCGSWGRLSGCLKSQYDVAGLLNQADQMAKLGGGVQFVDLSGNKPGGGKKVIN